MSSSVPSSTPCKAPSSTSSQTTRALKSEHESLQIRSLLEAFREEKNVEKALLCSELKNVSSRVTYLESQGLLGPSTGEQSLSSAQGQYPFNNRERKNRAELHHHSDLGKTPDSVKVRALDYGEDELLNYEEQTNWELSNSDSPDGATY